MNDMERWYSNLREDGDYHLTNDFFLLLCDSTPIGVGGYTRIDWRNRKAELSFYVAEVDNEEIITEALNKTLLYGLATLNLYKIYFPVYSFNPRLEIYKKVMLEEYTAYNEYFWEGKYYHRVVLVKYGHI